MQDRVVRVVPTKNSGFSVTVLSAACSTTHYIKIFTVLLPTKLALSYKYIWSFQKLLKGPSNLTFSRLESPLRFGRFSLTHCGSD